MKINVVLPFFNQNPVGGIKVMYQYANEMAERGHDVFIYHAMYTPWMPGGGQGFRKKKNKFFQHILRLKRRRKPNWFELHSSIKSIEIIDISNDLIRNADIVFSTWWSTALEAFKLKAAKGAKFNLIQGSEDVMTAHTDLVYSSYRLPVNHIVISSYLKEVVFNHSGLEPAMIHNAIDPAVFHLKQPIKGRDPSKIIMLYAEVYFKGTKYGLEALKQVAKKYPQIKVHLFGVIESPVIDFPKYVIYHYKPDNLPQLYNECGIFVSPSLNDGWGLPAMEAMACGCACVCTKIEGHLDFMSDYDTALFVQPQNSEQLAGKIMELLADDSLRLKIAESANENVKTFTWKNSADQLENMFENTCK